jgi:hypothetical protein
MWPRQVHSWHLTTVTQANQEKPQSRQPILWAMAILNYIIMQDDSAHKSLINSLRYQVLTVVLMKTADFRDMLQSSPVKNLPAIQRQMLPPFLGLLL